MKDNQIDWGNPSIAGQPAIKIYTNPKGQCVIRQEGPYGDDDAWVYVSRSSVRALVVLLEQWLDGELEND